MRSPYSVAQLTQHIKGMLEADPLLRDVWVQGEVSNWFRSSAGHCYFTLKDAQATLRAVIWRTSAERLRFSPRDGQSVLAHGHVSVYEPQGQYQLYVDAMSSTGIGALYIQFEELKARLDSEGLFDELRKRPLPPYPQWIGVVTSAQGAAFRDICNVLSRRWPLAGVVLAPTLVQGDAAPEQIVRALRTLYGREEIDLILLARGGGSIEDLWAFNSEQVARTIVDSPVPVVTGIGHEVDFTIADFVADRRAPTPSAAAEVAVPDQSEVREGLRILSENLAASVRQSIDENRHRLDIQAQSLGRVSPRFRIERERQAVDDLQRRLDRSRHHHLVLVREQVQGLQHRLQVLAPSTILNRGYAVVRRPDGEVIRLVTQAVPGEIVAVRVADGEFKARVEQR